MFAYAHHAYLKIGDNTPDRESGQGHAMAAIVFSATAAEVFINEVGFLAKRIAKEMPHNCSETTALFAKLWDELGPRSSTKAKFILAKTILTDEPYDQKEPPFSHFSLLLTLRDQLLHMSKYYETYIEKGIIKTKPWKFLDKHFGPLNLLAVDETNQMGWPTRVTTKAMARWACNTVEAMVESLIQSMPSSLLGVQLEKVYHGRFSLSIPSSTPISDDQSTSSKTSE